MSQRDRLFQSISSAREQVLGHVDTLREGVNQRLEGSSLVARSGLQSGTSGRQNGTEVAQPASGSTNNGADLNRNNTLPLYSSRNTGPPVPTQALKAPPGQSQSEVDALRARRANNGEPGSATAGMPQTVHSYRGAGGRAILELHTPPQVTPTYMGGTEQRGRGAMVGQLSFTPQAREKITHITLKLKAVALVRVPNANPNTPYPATIAGRSPALEATTEREVLLIQLEQLLYQPSATNREKFFEMPPSSEHDQTVTWPFRFELPAEDAGGRALPASWVLSADANAQPPQNVRESRGAMLVNVGKGLLSNIKNAGAPAASQHEWGSIKWYLKATIARPSVLEANDRIFVPFTYLPPPPPRMQPMLERRQQMTQQLRQNVSFGRLVESSGTWQEIGVGSAAAEKDRPGLLGSLFGSSGKRKESEWTLEMPSQPAIFTLQGSIPFCLASKTPRRLGVPLQVSLFRRINLVSRATRAVDTRKICSARIATQPTTLVSSKTGQTTYRWQGVLDLPPTCGPCFDTQIVSLEYFIGIQEDPQAPYIHAEPIVLMCAPAKVLGAPSAPVRLSDPPVAAVAPVPTSPTLSQQAGPLPPEGGFGAPPVPGRPSGPSSPVVGTAAAAAGSSMVPSTNQCSATAPPSAADQYDTFEQDGTQLDLPPSYFEATGIHDAD